MNRRREDALEAALEALARGASIDEAVAGMPPEEAREVRQMLGAAVAAARLKAEEPPVDAARRSRSRLMRHAAASSASAAPRAGARVLIPRFAAAALVALTALILGLGGLNEAAADSLPGDVLYAVKAASEGLRLRLEFEAGQRLRLQELYAEARLEDVRQLLALGRVVPVSFKAQVESMESVLWLAAGIPIRLSPATTVVGEIRPGMVVAVEGTTQTDGTIQGDEIRLESYDMLGTLEVLDGERAVVDGQSLLRTPDSYFEAGLVPGDRVLVRVGVDDGGVCTLVSAIRFAPPTPTTAPPPPATAAPMKTAPQPPTPTNEPTQDHSGPGNGSGSEDDEPEATATQGDDEEQEEEEEEEAERIDFEGVVESIGGSTWVIDGRAVLVDGETEIKDDPEVGDAVRVRAWLQPDGSWWAERIELED